MITLTLQLIARIICKPILHLFFNFQVYQQGWSPSRAQGPLLLVSNHPTFFDFIFIGVTLPLNNKVWPVGFLVSQSYASVKKGIFAFFVHFGGGVTVTRTENGKKSLQEVLQNAERALDQKRILFVFPQGKMIREALISKGGRGAAYLAMKHNIQLVPFFVEVDQEKQGFSRFLSRRNIAVRIGKPFFIKGNYANNENLQHATVEIIDKINQLHYV